MVAQLRGAEMQGFWVCVILALAAVALPSCGGSCRSALNALCDKSCDCNKFECVTNLRVDASESECKSKVDVSCSLVENIEFDWGACGEALDDAQCQSGVGVHPST